MDIRWPDTQREKIWHDTRDDSSPIPLRNSLQRHERDEERVYARVVLYCAMARVDLNRQGEGSQ